MESGKHAMDIGTYHFCCLLNSTPTTALSRSMADLDARADVGFE